MRCCWIGDQPVAIFIERLDDDQTAHLVAIAFEHCSIMACILRQCGQSYETISIDDMRHSGEPMTGCLIDIKRQLAAQEFDNPLARRGSWRRLRTVRFLFPRSTLRSRASYRAAFELPVVAACPDLNSHWSNRLSLPGVAPTSESVGNRIADASSRYSNRRRFRSRSRPSISDRIVERDLLHVECLGQRTRSVRRSKMPARESATERNHQRRRRRRPAEHRRTRSNLPTGSASRAKPSSPAVAARRRLLAALRKNRLRAANTIVRFASAMPQVSVARQYWQ